MTGSKWSVYTRSPWYACYEAKLVHLEGPAIGSQAVLLLQGGCSAVQILSNGRAQQAAVPHLTEAESFSLTGDVIHDMHRSCR